MLSKRTELEMRLALAMREKWQENAVEALVGALSSVTTEGQLEALIKAQRV